MYQEEPIVVPEPEPVVRSAPVRSAPAPAPFVPYQPEPEPPAAVVKSAPVPVHPVFHQERAAYAAFMPVPAVPEDHFSAVNYMAGPTLPPALAPAPPVQATSRAAEIVPVFNNEIPQVRPKHRLEHNQITTYLVQLKFSLSEKATKICYIFLRVLTLYKVNV